MITSEEFEKRTLAKRMECVRVRIIYRGAYMAKEKIDRAQMRIDEEHAQHRGEWLTQEVCDQYRLEAEQINEFDPQDVRRHREMRLELQQKYGLTEVEAINILNGNNISDYLLKYRRIMNREPIIEKK